MIKLNEANRFLSASKDKSMKLWRLPGSYSKDPNLQGNSIDNSGDDLQGTEYYYKDVDQLKEEDSEDQLNRRKSSYSGSSRSENSNQTSSDSEVDYRNIQRVMLPSNLQGYSGKDMNRKNTLPQSVAPLPINNQDEDSKYIKTGTKINGELYNSRKTNKNIFIDEDENSDETINWEN